MAVAGSSQQWSAQSQEVTGLFLEHLQIGHQTKMLKRIFNPKDMQIQVLTAEGEKVYPMERI